MGNQVTKQAVISEQSALNPNQVAEKFALFGPDGTPVSFDALLVQTGADVVLTGYEAGEAGAVAATDTVNEAVAKLEAGLADIAPDTGADVVLTGYVAGTAGAIAATDTVNEAVAKLEAGLGEVPADTGADVVLTGYVAGVADDVAATDTINEAIAKLEARIATLEA